jgi:hypothetical protein
LEKTLETIITWVNTAKGYLAKLKDKIKEYKADRKKPGDGIASEMVIVLKKFGIE